MQTETSNLAGGTQLYEQLTDDKTGGQDRLGVTPSVSVEPPSIKH